MMTAHDRLAEADRTGLRHRAWLVEVRLATYIFVEMDDNRGLKYEVVRGLFIGSTLIVYAYYVWADLCVY